MCLAIEINSLFNYLIELLPSHSKMGRKFKNIKDHSLPAGREYQPVSADFAFTDVLVSFRRHRATIFPIVVLTSS
jgi:hypothetical protein